MATQRPTDAQIQSAGLGDQRAFDAVYDGLYDELHSIAAQQMARESSSNLLQTTAIVHEAYVKLASQNQSKWRDRQSFFAAAAVVMRRLLIDNARKEKSKKRGGQRARQLLSDSRLRFDERAFGVLEISDALEKLAEFAPEQSEALELMIFGGMTGEEVAKHLGVSASTIDRKVRSGKAWLRRELA